MWPYLKFSLLAGAVVALTTLALQAVFSNPWLLPLAGWGVLCVLAVGALWRMCRDSAYES